MSYSKPACMNTITTVDTCSLKEKGISLVKQRPWVEHLANPVDLVDV